MSRLGAKPSSSGHWTCVLLLVTSCYWLLLLHGGVESAYIRARRQPVKDDLSSSNSSNTQRFDEPFSSVNKTGANKPKRSPDDLHTFYQFLVSKGLNRFCKLLRQANIEDTLSSVGPFTLFAPTDEAFAFLPGKALEEIRTDVTKLRKFLLYHIVPGSISSVDIQNEKVINSADGSPIRFNVYSNGQVATASGAQIVEADIRHTNYIVHIVDHVLYPPPTLDIISQIKQKHDTLYRLLVSADFTDYLSGGTFTVFAPSDEAFRVLPKSIRDLLYTNITVLQRVLLNHIVPGTYFSPGLPVGSHLTSQSNVPLYITTARGLLLVNKIPIVESDVPVSNGVIHFLNRVLLPPDVIEDCNCLKPLSTTPSPNKDKNPTPQEEPNKDSGKPQQPSRSTKSPGGPQPDLPENEKPQSVDNPKEPKLNERNYPFNPLYPPDETSTDQKPNVPTSNQPDNPRTDKDRQQPFPQNPNEQRPPGFPYYPNNPEQSPTPNEQKPTSQQQPNDNQPQQPYYPNVPTNDQPLNKPAYEDYEGQPYPINPYEQSYPYNTPEQVPKRPSQQEPAVPIQTDSPSRQPSPPYFPNEEPFQPYPRPNVPPTGNEKTPGISPQLGQPQPNLQCSETPNAPECQYTPPQSGQPQPSIQCSEAPNAPECQYTPPQSGQPQPNIQCSETPNAPECQYAPPQSRPPPNLQCNETPNAPGCQYDTQPLQPNVLPTKIPTGPEDPQSKPSRPSLPRETKSPRIPPKYNTKSEIPESVTDPYGEQPQPDQYPKRKPNIPQSITKTPATEDELPTLGNPGNQYDKPQPYLPRKEQTPTDEKPPTSKEDSTPPTEEFYTPYTRGHTRAPTSILTSRATPQSYTTSTTEAPAVSPEHPIPEIPELSFGGPDGETPNTVVDLLEKPNLTVDNKPVTFSVILTMMHDIGLPNILSNRGPFTMCIPTDEAFSGLPNGLLNQLQNNKNMLRKIILYHVVASRIPSTDLKENQILRTFQGPPLFVNVRNGGKMVLVGGSRVVGTKQTKEGVVYIMDRVLSTLPDDNVLTALRRRPHLSQFSNFLRESPLRNFLRRRGPFTLFAPTNEAWNSLPEEITNILATNATALNEVLFNHVVNGAHYTNAIPNNELLIPTPQGGTLKFRIAPDGAYVNSANILYPDISTGNGLVHVIDRVILTAPPLTTFERQGSNGQQPQTPQNHQPANKIDFPTLYNAADDMKINTFLGWLEQANLLNELHPDVNYTIFAPTDDAISALPPTLLKAINNDVNQLMPIVKYHVVPENIPAKKVHNEMTAPTLLPGKDVRFNFYQNHANLTVAGSPVGPEKKVGNILLTVVSRVLYPPSGDIYSTISKSPILQDLKQAITMAGLEDLLKGPGPFTVFAPTETAFRNLPKAEYLRFFNNPDLLRGLLLHHIVNGTVFLSGIDNGVTLTPLRGDKLNVTITPNHMGVNGLNILYSDITATNGVIHVLDHLLL